MKQGVIQRYSKDVNMHNFWRTYNCCWRLTLQLRGRPQLREFERLVLLPCLSKTYVSRLWSIRRSRSKWDRSRKIWRSRDGMQQAADHLAAPLRSLWELGDWRRGHNKAHELLLGRKGTKHTGTRLQRTENPSLSKQFRGRNKYPYHISYNENRVDNSIGTPNRVRPCK